MLQEVLVVKHKGVIMDLSVEHPLELAKERVARQLHSQVKTQRGIRFVMDGGAGLLERARSCLRASVCTRVEHAELREGLCAH